MDVQYHRELQQARQRIARNRRVLQGDALRLSHNVQAKLNWRLQSQKHPLIMLLGAVAVGVVASRLVSSVAGSRDWRRTLFRWATRRLDGNLWRNLLKMVWPRKEEQTSAEEADAASSEESS